MPGSCASPNASAKTPGGAISGRGGVLGATDTVYQRDKIQEESLRGWQASRNPLAQ